MARTSASNIATSRFRSIRGRCARPSTPTASAKRASPATGIWSTTSTPTPADFGGTDKSLGKANEELDKLSLDEASKEKADTAKVEACIKKQDDTAIKASLKMGDGLGVEATPVLFINGERLEGAYPLVDVFRMIDGALVAAGVTPPPQYKEPAPPVMTPTTPAKPDK